MPSLDTLNNHRFQVIATEALAMHLKFVNNSDNTIQKAS